MNHKINTKLCIRCRKHPKLAGSTLCIECKAAAIQHRREYKRNYDKNHPRPYAKKGEKIWTTTSITTLTTTTNGSNPPKVQAQVTTSPATQQVKMCTRCGKFPSLGGHNSICRECHNAYNREWYRNRRAEHKHPTDETTTPIDKISEKIVHHGKRLKRVKRTEKPVQMCIQCGQAPCEIGRRYCTECRKKRAREYTRVWYAKRKAIIDASEQPLVIQQNIQNSAPTPAEKPAVVPDTVNVNVTSPIKVDIQHTDERPQHWWAGYFLAIAFFLLWLGHAVKSWLR